MASINGITVKSVKQFRDHEGALIAQGNVYYNGKKLGFWSQDGWGGPDRYEFDKSLLKDEVEKYKASDRVDAQYRDIVNLDCFMYDLINLLEDEKQYKKCIKKGYKSYIVWSDRGLVKAFYSSSDKEAVKSSDFYKKFCKECNDETGEKVTIYSDLSDFDIRVA